MVKQLTDPRTARKRFRYRSGEMSGALPAVLYKYLPLRHARTMIDIGALMFSSLSWFQNLEDPDRGDGFEGAHKYFPIDGLQITKTGSGGKLDLTWKRLTLPSDSLQSRAAGRVRRFFALIESPRLDGYTLVDHEVGRHISVRLISNIRKAEVLEVGVDDSLTSIHRSGDYFSFIASAPYVRRSAWMLASSSCSS